MNEQCFVSVYHVYTLIIGNVFMWICEERYVKQSVTERCGQILGRNCTYQK
jgi:hypothetical protein